MHTNRIVNIINGQAYLKLNFNINNIAAFIFLKIIEYYLKYIKLNKDGIEKLKGRKRKNIKKIKV